MRIISPDEGQFTNYAFEIDRMVEMPNVDEKSVPILDEIVHGSDNQDEIKKDYHDARAIEEALQKQLDADNDKIKSLLRTMIDLNGKILNLQNRINNTSDPDTKQAAQKALDEAKKAFDALESDQEKMIKSVASSEQQIGEIGIKITALLFLTYNPDPAAEDVQKAHQNLQDVKKLQNLISAQQTILDALSRDFVIHEADVISGIDKTERILR